MKPLLPPEPRSKIEEAFAGQLKLRRVEAPQREHRFCERKWRFDFAWPEKKIAVEIEGGVRAMGRHQRPEGFSNDIQKYNRAVMLGWRVLRFTGRMVKSGEALSQLEEILAQETEMSQEDIESAQQAEEELYGACEGCGASGAQTALSCDPFGGLCSGCESNNEEEEGGEEE